MDEAVPTPDSISDVKLSSSQSSDQSELQKLIDQVKSAGQCLLKTEDGSASDLLETGEVRIENEDSQMSVQQQNASSEIAVENQENEVSEVASTESESQPPSNQSQDSQPSQDDFQSQDSGQVDEHHTQITTEDQQMQQYHAEAYNQQQYYHHPQHAHDQYPAPTPYHVHPTADGPLDMTMPSAQGCCAGQPQPMTYPRPHVPCGGDADSRPATKISNGRRVGIKPQNPKFDRTRRFPEKLYDAACDMHIEFIRWSATGKAIIVNERQFEDHVMHMCAGLVQCDSFENFRRQLREYCFECRYINMPYQYDYEFIHPNFQYQREELLELVKTRRRILKDDRDAAVQECVPMPPRKPKKRRGSNVNSANPMHQQEHPPCKHLCQHHHQPPTPQHFHQHHAPQCQHGHHAANQWSYNHFASGDGAHCNMHMHGHANCSPVPWSSPVAPSNMGHMHPSGSHSCGSLTGHQHQHPHHHVAAPHTHSSQPQPTSPHEVQHSTSQGHVPSQSSSEMSLSTSPHSLGGHQSSSKEASPVSWQYSQQQHSCAPSHNQQMWGYAPYHQHHQHHQHQHQGWNHHSCSPFSPPGQYQQMNDYNYQQHYYSQGQQMMDAHGQQVMQQDPMNQEVDNAGGELIYLQEPQVNSNPTMMMPDGSMMQQPSVETSSANIIVQQHDGSALQSVDVSGLQVEQGDMEQITVATIQNIDPATLETVDTSALQDLQQQQVKSNDFEQQQQAENSVVTITIQKEAEEEKNQDPSTPAGQTDTNSIPESISAHESSSGVDIGGTSSLESLNPKKDPFDDESVDGEVEKEMIEVAQVHAISSNTQMLTNFTMLDSGDILDQGESLQQQLQQQIAASQ